MSELNHCQRCGACCATFRVSFYWAESTAAEAGTVPVELTEQISPYHSCMKGTQGKSPRCVALAGTVGEEVACTIYAQRSTPCRDFNILDDDGSPNPRCAQARARHGLPPIDVVQLA